MFFYALNKTSWGFCGSYDGSYSLFSGLATDEVYLIKAESLVRLNQPGAALAILGQLSDKRYEAEAQSSVNPEDQEGVLHLILKERQKELYGRGLRWTDLRRLNAEGRNIHMTHTYLGKIYTLEPLSPRYTWPIPPEEINFHPDMPQNPR